MNFKVTYVFRNGNSCADGMTNLGVENMFEFV